MSNTPTPAEMRGALSNIGPDHPRASTTRRWCLQLLDENDELRRKVTDSDYAVGELKHNPDNAYFHGEQEGWRLEREAIVAWIRSQAQGRLDCATYMRIAEAIEYGDHQQGATGGEP